VRAARFALNRARLDVPNDASNNGEHALQRWVLATVLPTRPVTVLDVGANVGEWSVAMLDEAHRSGHELSLHAFEPSSHTHRLLAARLPDCVHINQIAVSSRTGPATLHIVHPGAGTNSLHETSVSQATSPHTEVVTTTTIDDYVQQHDIGRIDLLKIDTEGHDFSVLAGAEESLKAGIVSVAQFEYNHRWVHARHFLKDAFDLLEPLGYRIGKLTPLGVETYSGWDPDLETFVEGNYVTFRGAAVNGLPQVRWWKS
jgi:FkbM family methyltransferase